ncbi:MAG: 4'-phosphopantetheinyl transferase superfamily protein [Lewinella sp.]|nr:4'-phosphopantetheinyl transferase superfamily protein [Lewinella sp.]
MPILRHDRVDAGGELGLWQITESEEWFLDALLLYPAELRQLASVKGRRRVEWLAVRQLVHIMSGRERRGAFVKDEHGKPHLEQTDWHLSISHSHELAAAIASPRLCGIDVQYIVPKITRLAPKFLNGPEAESLEPATELDQLHVYWGAKEALYKAHGRRQLDFKEHILVEPFSYRQTRGQTTARVVKDAERLDFDVWYERSAEGYMLVWVMESNPAPFEDNNH